MLELKFLFLDKDNNHHWKVKMHLYLLSQDEAYVDCIERGPHVPMRAVTGNEPYVPKPRHEWSNPDIEQVRKDKMAMNILFNGLDGDMFDNIINCKTAKEVWDTIQIICDGTEQDYKEFTLERLYGILKTYELEIEQDERMENSRKKGGLVWRGIISAKELIEEGSRIKVGNGTSINKWNDPWIPETDNAYLTTRRPQELFNVTVRNLLKDEAKEWDRDLIHDLFNDEDARRILKIPLSKRLSGEAFEEKTGEAFERKGTQEIQQRQHEIAHIAHVSIVGEAYLVKTTNGLTRRFEPPLQLSVLIAVLACTIPTVATQLGHPTFDLSVAQGA
ncbi:hypothetical protein AgCh_023218 [Apium graveolens]